eukprot:1108485-Rhodomonas_salina.2
MGAVVHQRVHDEAPGGVSRTRDAELGPPADGAQVGRVVVGKVGTIQGRDQGEGHRLGERVGSE